jgi:hypothetical protein
VGYAKPGHDLGHALPDLLYVATNVPGLRALSGEARAGSLSWPGMPRISVKASQLSGTPWEPPASWLRKLRRVPRQSRSD